MSESFELLLFSYQGVKKTITVMKYIKAAVQQSMKGDKGRSKAKEIIRATIPKVQDIIDVYDKLEKNTEVLKTKTNNILLIHFLHNTQAVTQ